MWCCVEPARVEKTLRIMQAMADGFGGKLVAGVPPDDDEPFAIWGQMWTTLEAVPRAIKRGRPFFHIDNGYIHSAKGGVTGYYRITYRGMSPVLLNNTPMPRFNVPMRPWRRGGSHVVLALPGAGFGRAIGLDMSAWVARSQTMLRQATNRRILVRPKKCGRGIATDLTNAWALVTHSSNVAVDAVVHGIPVFVAPTSPAAPVGNLDLKRMKGPLMPPREAWLASLVAQQFTLEEIRSGFAKEMMDRVVAQVDRPTMVEAVQ